MPRHPSIIAPFSPRQVELAPLTATVPPAIRPIYLQWAHTTKIQWTAARNRWVKHWVGLLNSDEAARALDYVAQRVDYHRKFVDLSQRQIKEVLEVGTTRSQRAIKILEDLHLISVEIVPGYQRQRFRVNLGWEFDQTDTLQEISLRSTRILGGE
jgi:hypothetical protein